MKVTVDNNKERVVFEHLKEYIGQSGDLKYEFTNSIGKKLSVVEFDNGSCSCWLSDMVSPVEIKNKTIEVNMTNNKHPHHDLIVEWAKDTSKTFQWRRGCNGRYDDCVVPTWSTELEYRIKPREFIKGHWYPCVKSGSMQVLMWTGFNFSTTSTCYLSQSYKDTYFDDIEKSIGEIKFGSDE